jgi:hypothetical protein
MTIKEKKSVKTMSTKTTRSGRAVKPLKRMIADDDVPSEESKAVSPVKKSAPTEKSTKSAPAPKAAQPKKLPLKKAPTKRPLKTMIVEDDDVPSEESKAVSPVKKSALTEKSTKSAPAPTSAPSKKLPLKNLPTKRPLKTMIAADEPMEQSNTRRSGRAVKSLKRMIADDDDDVPSEESKAVSPVKKSALTRNPKSTRSALRDAPPPPKKLPPPLKDDDNVASEKSKDASTVKKSASTRNAKSTRSAPAPRAAVLSKKLPLKKSPTKKQPIKKKIDVPSEESKAVSPVKKSAVTENFTTSVPAPKAAPPKKLPLKKAPTKKPLKTMIVEDDDTPSKESKTVSAPVTKSTALTRNVKSTRSAPSRRAAAVQPLKPSPTKKKAEPQKKAPPVKALTTDEISKMLEEDWRGDEKEADEEDSDEDEITFNTSNQPKPLVKKVYHKEVLPTTILLKEIKNLKTRAPSKKKPSAAAVKKTAALSGVSMVPIIVHPPSIADDNFDNDPVPTDDNFGANDNDDDGGDNIVFVTTRPDHQTEEVVEQQQPHKSYKTPMANKRNTKLIADRKASTPRLEEAANNDNVHKPVAKEELIKKPLVKKVYHQEVLLTKNVEDKKVPIYMRQPVMTSSVSNQQQPKPADLTNDPYEVTEMDDEIVAKKAKKKSKPRKKNAGNILTFGTSKKTDVARMLKEIKNLKTPAPSKKKPSAAAVKKTVALSGVSMVPIIVHPPSIADNNFDNDPVPTDDNFGANDNDDDGGDDIVFVTTRPDHQTEEVVEQQQPHKSYKTPMANKRNTKLIADRKASTPRLEEAANNDNVHKPVAKEELMKKCFGFDDSMSSENDNDDNDDKTDNESLVGFSPVKSVMGVNNLMMVSSPAPSSVTSAGFTRTRSVFSSTMSHQGLVKPTTAKPSRFVAEFRQPVQRRQQCSRFLRKKEKIIIDNKSTTAFKQSQKQRPQQPLEVSIYDDILNADRVEEEEEVVAAAATHQVGWANIRHIFLCEIAVLSPKIQKYPKYPKKKNRNGVDRNNRISCFSVD